MIGINIALIIFGMSRFMVESSPSTCPSAPNVKGYSEWKDLKKDIQLGSGGTFTICPGSNFKLDKNSNYHWIYIIRDRTPLTVQCGNDGSADNKCIIDGGYHHFWVEKGAIVELKGITMKNAERGSVWTQCCDVKASFENCIWTGNQYIPFDSSGAAAAIESYGADDLTFKSCQFLDNQALLGAIHNRYGPLKIDHCLFQRNKSTWSWIKYGVDSATPTGSAITTDMSDVWITYSCFQENDSSGSGTVKLCHFCPLQMNENNFFENNLVRSKMPDTGEKCDTIYKYDIYDNDKCYDSDGKCCEVFTGSNCPRHRRVLRSNQKEKSTLS